MPKNGNSALKKKARSLAAFEGIPYSAALARLASEEGYFSSSQATASLLPRAHDATAANADLAGLRPNQRRLTEIVRPKPTYTSVFAEIARSEQARKNALAEIMRPKPTYTSVLGEIARSEQARKNALAEIMRGVVSNQPGKKASA
ncbi:hypothetical protein O1L60_18180 [Streptomyces diastatochromogenes]|nr:hypothetical protein [Streptomyces diastatochromogenes]